MKIVRTALFGVGLLAVLIGVVWMGQGSGYFPYPASSFMIDQSVWITRGAIVAAVGAILAVISTRLKT